MNTKPHIAGPSSDHRQPLVLARTQVGGRLGGGRAVIALTLDYRNSEDVAIEAIHTFPLPVDATVLGLTARINETLCVSRVVPVPSADHDYEAALDANDTAVLLTQVAPGVFNLNLGQLPAGGAAELTLHFVVPLQWAGDEIRFCLPTTIAPRQMPNRQAGPEPAQMPAPNLLAEHQYSLDLQAGDELADAKITSPTHTLTLEQQDQGQQIAFAEGFALADRDLILRLRPKSEPMNAIRLVADGERFVAQADFHVPLRQGHQPLALTLLIDGSASMAGDAIAQARRGAQQLVESLQADDRFGVFAFGDRIEAIPGCDQRLMPADDKDARQRATRFVERLDATLGSKNLLHALASVFAIGDGADVLLFTDGQTWEYDDLIAHARAAGNRVFVTGVGSSPNEAVLRALANATGGGAESVHIPESIEAVIARQLARMRSPRMSSAQLTLPGNACWQAPSALERFAVPGETLRSFIGLDRPVDGTGHLHLSFANGTELSLSAEIHALPADDERAAELPRVAASMRMREALNDDQAADRDALIKLAIGYQILSPLTSCLITQEGPDPTGDDFPALRHVPNMLAAGWGGVGTIEQTEDTESKAAVKFSRRRTESDGEPGDTEYPDSVDFQLDETLDPSNLPPGPMYSRSFERSNEEPCYLIEQLNPRFTLFGFDQRVMLTLPESHEHRAFDSAARISDEVLAGLLELIKTGWREEQVVMAFWLALLGTDLSDRFTWAHRRSIRRTARHHRTSRVLIDWIGQALAATSGFKWSWAPAGPLPRNDAAGAPTPR